MLLDIGWELIHAPLPYAVFNILFRQVIRGYNTWRYGFICHQNCTSRATSYGHTNGETDVSANRCPNQIQSLCQTYLNSKQFTYGNSTHGIYNVRLKSSHPLQTHNCISCRPIRAPTPGILDTWLHILLKSVFRKIYCNEFNTEGIGAKTKLMQHRLKL